MRSIWAFCKPNSINSSQCTDHCSSILRNMAQNNITVNGTLNIYNAVKGGQKRAPESLPVKQEKQRKKSRPEGIVNICRYQDKCTKAWGACKFQHVPPYAIKGCKTPYSLCWDYQRDRCQRLQCRYVHWKPKPAKVE